MEEKQGEIESFVKLEELYCDACQRSHNISTILRCSQCKAVYYCSKECQKMHWKQHKACCQEYVHIQEEIRQREEYVNSVLQSCCTYVHRLDDESGSFQGNSIKPLEEAEKPSYLKVFDLSHRNSMTCEICYEVVPASNFTFPTCNHKFCMNCVQSYFTLLDDGKEPPVKELTDTSHFSPPTDSTISRQRCPLCRNDNDPFDATLWQFAYSNVNDFLFQRNLFPSHSLPHHHYTLIAKREYKRFKLIEAFPADLAPLQFDVLKLKMIPLMMNSADDADDALLSDQSDDDDLSEERRKYCQQLLQRGIKDISLKLEIYQTYLQSLLHLKEVKKAKELCETILEEVSDLPKSSLILITSSTKSQEIISTIQYYYMHLLSQEDDHAKEEKQSFEHVIALIRSALQQHRHDARLYELLSKVYDRKGDREEATRILLVGLRYVLPWDKSGVKQLQDNLMALQRKYSV